MTVLRKRNAGEIPFFRVGIRVLYSVEKHLIPYLGRCENENCRDGQTADAIVKNKKAVVT